MGILETLADVANAALPEGVNWAAQAQQYPTWQESIEAYRTDKGYGYFADLVAAKNAVTLVLLSVGVDPMRARKPEYDSGVQGSVRSIETDRAFLEQAISAKAQNLSKPLVFDSAQLRELLQGQMAILYQGFRLHQTKMIFFMGLTPDQIKEHADKVCRAYRQLYYLFQSGVLEPLRIPSLRGVGVVPPVPTSIVVGLVLLVAVIAAAIVASSYLTEKNRAAEKVCMEMIQQKHPAASAFCGQASQVDLNVVNGLNPIAAASSVLNNILFWGVIGVGVYALVVYMPYIAGQVTSSRKQLRGAT